jgi:hypothetical protein
MYWLLGRKSKLSTNNKLFLYKARLKQIWTYGIQLWGMASTSNTEMLECFQSKTLRMIVDAPWYVPNTVIRRDLQIPTVKEEIQHYSSQYSARLSAHPNDLIANLMEMPNRWLRRHLPNSVYQSLSVIVVFVILVFKVQLLNFIPKSRTRLWPYYLQRSATEHSSAWLFTQFAECAGTDCK